MTRRERLSNRHAHEVVRSHYKGIAYTATLASYPDGRPAEIFLSASVKYGSELQHHLDVACIAVSLALQHGVPVEVLRHSIKVGPVHHALGLFDGPPIKVVQS